MPAAHTAERATRSQRGTDTRSRTGAAILPPPSASARDARPAPAGRARAPISHWLAGRARPSPPRPAERRRTWRSATTSRQAGAGGGVARRAVMAPPGGREAALQRAPPSTPTRPTDFSRKMRFSLFFPQFRAAILERMNETAAACSHTTSSWCLLCRRTLLRACYVPKVYPEAFREA